MFGSLMRILASLLAIALVGCAGYTLDGAKPAAMSGVESISVMMFGNETLHPRAEALATSAVNASFIQDGTYRIASRGDADAVLEGTIEKIEYAQSRATRLDTLRPEELQNTVTLQWTLRDATDSNRVLATGRSVGVSRFFVDSNLQTARNNALPDALRRASEALVSRLANGF